MPGWLQDKLHTPTKAEGRGLMFWIGVAIVLIIVVAVGRKMADNAPTSNVQAATTTRPSVTSGANSATTAGMGMNTPSTSQRAANSMSREFANSVPVDAYGNPVPANQPSAYLHPDGSTGLPPMQTQPVPTYGSGNQEGGQQQDDSPVAISYRQAATLAQVTPPGNPTDPPASVNELELARQLASLSAPNQVAAGAQETETHRVKKAENDDVVIVSGGRKEGGNGNRYVIPEGSWFQCTLINRLAGEYSGPVICGVAVDVWDHSAKHILLPSGSPDKPGERATVIGESYQVGDRDQKRLAIAFHQITYWKGETRVRISLDKFTGLDQAGETGIHDKVNNHWLQVFGAAAAIGVVGGLTYSGTGSAITASGLDIYRQQVGTEVGMEGSQILSRFLNKMPEITIQEGHPINVYVGTDLWVPAVDELQEVQQ